MRDAENHGMDYAHSFINDDGFEEWLTCDDVGNDVRCYYNELMNLEIHTKEPICKFCKTLLHKIDTQAWNCPACGKSYTYEDIINSFDEAKSNRYKKHRLCDDYGAFMYPGASHMAGPNELYDEMTSMS